MYDQMPIYVWIPLMIIVWTAFIATLIIERRRRKGKQQ